MIGSQDAEAAAEARVGFDSYVIANRADGSTTTPPAGTHLALRQAGSLKVALHTGDGRELGLLPPAEVQALWTWFGELRALRARVRAVVPGAHRPRILVRIEAGS